MTAKDFGPIENDYAFFMAHATEAETDQAQYCRELTDFAAGRTTLRMLDFGCGAGDFSVGLMSALHWPADVLRITLVEPVQHQREAAARRLAGFSSSPIPIWTDLPAGAESQFDLVLSNHALYYVEDLAATLSQMRDLLLPGGKLLLAIAGWDNLLNQLWQTGFALLDRPVPFYVADDVAAILSQGGVPFRLSPVRYQLRFPDTEENRLKILRFLFGELLPVIGPQRLLGEFDRHVRGDQIEINTDSQHFVVEAQP